MEQSVRPKLVLLPGLDGSGRLFAPFIEQFPLAQAISIITYPTDRHIPFAELADYIIPKLPEHEPLVILGESYSGPVAISLAARPELNIVGLVLVATFARYPPSLLKALSRILPLSLLLRIPAPEFILRRFCFAEHTSDDLVRLVRSVIAENNPKVLASRAHEGGRVNVTALLSTLRMPCLIIQALDDKLIPANAVTEIERLKPDVEIVRLEGPHFILQTRARACYVAVSRFIQDISTRL